MSNDAGCRMRAIQCGGEIQLAGLAGRNSPDDYLIRITGKNLALITHAASFITDFGRSGIQVQLAAIINRVSVVREREPDIPERLISFLAERNAHEFLHGEVFGFLLFAIPKKLANLRQKLRRSFVLIFVRMTGPKSILVELQVFVRDAAEEHAAESAIADRKSFDPFLGGLFVPERKRRVGGQSELGQKDRK